MVSFCLSSDINLQNYVSKVAKVVAQSSAKDADNASVSQVSAPMTIDVNTFDTWRIHYGDKVTYERVQNIVMISSFVVRLLLPLHEAMPHHTAREPENDKVYTEMNHSFRAPTKINNNSFREMEWLADWH